jgi:hypothetical protein
MQNHFKEEERLWQKVMRIAASHNSTLVIAAGNDNILAGIEALQRPELFIKVAATDKKNHSVEKATFSNYGKKVTISAPGVEIYSTVDKDSYATFEGTSMAAPIVSGTVALMKSIDKSITTKKIICVLQSSGIKTTGNIGNLIQIDAALKLLISGTSIDCSAKPSTGNVQVLLKWNNYNDLDLVCTDPNSEIIYFKNRNSTTGGQLEIDMNIEYPESKTPIENIFWTSDATPIGMYNIYLVYYKNHQGERNETSYEIKVKYNRKTEIYSGIIRKEDKQIQICSFVVKKENGEK